MSLARERAFSPAGVLPNLAPLSHYATDLSYSFSEETSMRDLSSIVHSDPETLSGTPVFVGTRVPVRVLIEYLVAGDSLDKFLDAFPSVQREQAIAVIEVAGELASIGARSS